LAAVADHVQRAGAEQEFAALEAFGQLFAHGVLDHARAGKADQGLGLGDDHVAHEGKAGGHTTHRGIGQHADVGQLGLGQARERRIGLGHLQQAQQALLHARAAGGGKAHEGHLLFDGGFDTAHEAFAHHAAHAAAHELELEAGGDHGHAHHRTAHHHHGVGLAGGFQRRLQALRVLLAVLELQRVDRHHLLADLPAAFGVQEGIQPRPRADAVVVVALGADIEVALQIGLVEHRLAGRTLDPQAFGHGPALGPGPTAGSWAAAVSQANSCVHLKSRNRAPRECRP
jgi:hypothetical protein